MRPRTAILATLALLGGAPLAASISLAPRVAEAATAIELTMPDLVGNSTLVVAGTPLDRRSLWEGDASTYGRRIVTYTRVRVDRLIDGPAQSEVWVRTLGGEVDDIGQQVAGEAALRIAEPSLLFLRARNDGTHVVVGMSQGQYLLDDRPESGTVRVRTPLEGSHLVVKAVASPSAQRFARLALVGRTLDEVAQLVAAERRAHAP
ncbi:MAG TPA: hypothetical protein VK550_31005 [Polyangiaceae bacterium]|nr:hypothetical protein [Polyangiaceae bacterium]